MIWETIHKGHFNMKRQILIAISTAISLVLALACMLIMRFTKSLTGNEILDSVLLITAIGIMVFFSLIAVSETLYLTWEFNNIDFLTGIWNHRRIINYYKKMHAKGQLDRFCCIFQNVKDYKYINQKVGDRNGDIIMRIYANQLKSFLKGNGHIGRIGGDNFLVYVKKDHLPAYLDFIKAVKITIDINDEPVLITVRARCGILTDPAENPYKDCISYASIALSKAKRGTQDIVYYDKSMTAELIKEKEFLNEFNGALMTGEFVPYFQPKVNAQTNTLCGAEALARRVKNGQLLSPATFIPPLEKTGLVTKLDFHIYECVLKQIKDWESRGIKPVCVSVNFSKLHLRNDAFADNILSLREKYDVDPSYLEIELTESSGLDDYRRLSSFVSRMKRAGINISIDDFGTGYSSLSMISKFKANVIKLDKSFVDETSGGDESAQLFMKDIICMIKDQDEIVLCEGVETKKQLEFLKEAGCGVIQGFYFDKPLPAEEFEERLAKPKYTKE